MKIAVIPILVLVVAVTAPASADVGIGNSSLHLEAEATTENITVTDTDSDSQSGTILPLSAAVDALAIGATSTVHTHGTASAVWFSPADGVVNFEVGFESIRSGNGRAIIFPLSDGWEYSFVPDVDGLFTVDYNVQFTGSNTFGLNGFRMRFDGTQYPGGSGFFSGAGTISVPTFAGTTHHVQLFPGTNLFGGLETRNAHMSANLNWHFSIPEPSSIVVLLTAAVVSIQYRRRWPC